MKVTFSSQRHKFRDSLTKAKDDLLSLMKSKTIIFNYFLNHVDVDHLSTFVL